MAFVLSQGFGLIQFFQNRLQGVALLQLLQRPCQGLFQQACALGCQDRLRVELEAADAIRVVTYRHHHTVEMGVDG